MLTVCSNLSEFLGQLKTGLSKKMTCLQGLTAVWPYEVAQPKLILASSTIVFEQSRMAEIKYTNNMVYIMHYVLNGPRIARI